MARVALPIVNPLGPYPGAVAANALDVVFTVCDPTNDNQFALTGRELIVVRNLHATLARLITLTSSADPQKRVADIASYSLGALEFMMFWVGAIPGWDQSGQFFLDGETTDVVFAIVRIPG